MKLKDIRTASAMLALMEEHGVGRDDLVRVLGMMDEEGEPAQLDLLSTTKEPEPEPAPVPVPEVKTEPEVMEPSINKNLPPRLAEVRDLIMSRGGRIYMHEVAAAMKISKIRASERLFRLRGLGILRLVDAQTGLSEIVDLPPNRKVSVDDLPPGQAVDEVMKWIEGRPRRRAFYVEIAKALDMPPNKVNKICHRLLTTGHLHKVGRGVFFSTRK